MKLVRDGNCRFKAVYGDIMSQGNIVLVTQCTREENVVIGFFYDIVLGMMSWPI